jgi:hypothetical protein
VNGWDRSVNTTTTRVSLFHSVRRPFCFSYFSGAVN